MQIIWLIYAMVFGAALATPMNPLQGELSKDDVRSSTQVVAPQIPANANLFTVCEYFASANQEP